MREEDCVKDNREIGMYAVEVLLDEHTGESQIILEDDEYTHILNMTADDRRWLIGALFHESDDDWYDEQLSKAMMELREERTVGTAHGTIIWKDGINPFTGEKE